MASENLSKLAARADILAFDDDKRMNRSLVGGLIAGFLLAFWLSTVEIIVVATDFFERLAPESTAKLVIDIPEKEKKKEVKKKKKKKKKQLKKPKVKSYADAGVGRGDPRKRVTEKGLLAIITGKTKAKNAAGSAFKAKAFARNLDDIMKKIGGLKTAGRGNIGRAGTAGAKFNAGYAGGGGSGGIDDILGNLVGGAESISLKARTQIKPELPKHISGAAMTGARSPESIMRVVMQHIGGLKHAYNKRIKDKPGLKGRITVKMTIAASGSVTKAIVISSSMGDPILEEEVARRIKRWRFERIKKGEVTVEYPFSFSQ